MASATKKTTPEIVSMRKEIADITGRLPVSYDPLYLRTRLNALKRGVGVPRRATAPDRPHAKSVSISMTSDRIELIEHMADKSSMSVSQLVVRAIDEYAVAHGHANEVQRIARRSAS